MIRASLCLTLIILTMLAAIPVGFQTANSSHINTAPQGSSPYANDPDGSNVAFNVTYSQFDLYTKLNTTDNLGPPAVLTWSSKFTNQTGSPIPDTSFNYTLSPAVATDHWVNYTLTIPKGASTDLFLTFKWKGNLTAETSARYTVYNGTDFTKTVQGGNRTKIGPTIITGGPPINSTSLPPFPCGTTNECLRVSNYVGFNLTLSFAFHSNATGAGMTVEVSNVIVASVGSIPIASSSHTMNLKSNSTEVQHTAQEALTYNATVTYPKPHTNLTLTHTWRQMVVTFYFPPSYTLDSIKLNSTEIFQTAPNPINQGPCSAPFCTNSRFVSLNMTTNSSLATPTTIQATSRNAVYSIQTALQGVPTTFWTPGDKIGVKVVNLPGVPNATGSQNVWLTDPTGVNGIFNTTVSQTTKGGTFLYNLTQSLPSTPLGIWNVTTAFLTGYDYGILMSNFRLEQIQLKQNSFSMNGGAGHATALNIQGILVHAFDGSAAAGVNAEVFAVDSGSLPGLISTQGGQSSGLYISNITFASGVFTPDTQPLIAYFTVVNPTSLRQPFEANVTIEHEWSTGQTHGVDVTFPLALRDPLVTNPELFEADIRLGSGGIQIVVRNVANPIKNPYPMSIGTSPVSPNRQHFGLFRFTITSKNLSSSAVSSKPVESPTYAYLLNTALIPSRLLASSSAVTAGDGSFSASIVSDKILSAKRLAIFVLARDGNGIVLGDKDHDPTTTTDSTIILPTADIPSEVAVKQSVDVKLRLKSNSTGLNMTLTVNMDLPGSTVPTQTQTITLMPGATRELSFGFIAPSNAGPYLIVFSSPEYGAPLLTKNLQVSLIQSNLQILIPAIIGLVAALIILGVYMVRRRPETEVERSEKPRPPGGKPSKPQTGTPSSKSLTRS